MYTSEVVKRAHHRGVEETKSLHSQFRHISTQSDDMLIIQLNEKPKGVSYVSYWLDSCYSVDPDVIVDLDFLDLVLSLRHFISLCLSMQEHFNFQLFGRRVRWHVSRKPKHNLPYATYHLMTEILSCCSCSRLTNSN